MEGWIIDLTVKNDKVKLWFKTTKDKLIILERAYHPEFYIPKESLEKALDIVNSDLVQARIEVKKIFPSGKGEFIHLIFDTVEDYKKALEELEKRGVDTFNADLLHTQKFLFKHDLIPLVKYELKEDRLIYLDDDYRLEPVPLSILALSTNFSPSCVFREFTYRFNGECETVSGEEEFVLRELEHILKKLDPDLVLVNLEWDEFVENLLKRARIYFKHYSLDRSRVNVRKLRNYKFLIAGRLIFSYDDFEEMGLAGLEERCRFSRLPPKIAYRWTAGRLVDSRQCYVACKKGFLIPRSENLNLIVRTAWDIHVNDRGGMLQSPVVGLHENVAVLDFESMFPNIIVRYNVSYETVELAKVRRKPKGLLVEVVEPFLKRRLYFKHLKKRLGEPAKTWAEQRQSELKLLLVSSYGYSGNNFNRFGNPLTFEWINKISRIVMEKVYEIARSRGFQIVYSDTDSIFVKKAGAKIEDFERLAEEIGEATKLPIKVDRVYKFLVLLPMKTDKKLGGTKRYYGRLVSGELDFKGIEIRRHDYPQYIKEFQHKLADKLLSCERVEEVYDNLSECLNMVAHAVDEIVEHRVPPEKMIIRKILRRSEYKVLAPHYVAALQLRLNGYSLAPGDVVEFLYTNSGHRNPMMRVQAWKLYDGRGYDVEKYVQLLLDAAESILAVFDFNRARFYGAEKDYFDEIFEKYLIEKLDF